VRHVVSASRCPSVFADGKEFVHEGTGVEALALEIQSVGWLDHCVVFAEVVVEPFETDSEHLGRVLQVELAPGFVGSAVLALEVVFMAEGFGREKGIHEGVAHLLGGIAKPLTLDLVDRNGSFGQGKGLGVGLGQLHCNFEAEIDRPVDFLAGKALQSAGEEEPKQLFSRSHLVIVILLGLHPVMLPIDQRIDDESEQFLSILLVHVFVGPFGLADPIEQTFWREMLFFVFEVLGEEQVGLSQAAEISLGVHLKMIVSGMERLACI
jgi:hypothetical protein